MTPSSTQAACDYTVVVTSCRRFDLLQPSLLSLKTSLDVAPQRWIVVEDSLDAGVHDCVRSAGVDATILLNGVQMGQMRSIDRAYAEVTTPYVFHTEDDWTFHRSGFIRESHTLLEAYPKLSMVGLRSRPDQNPLARKMPALEHRGIGYVVADPFLHPVFFIPRINLGLHRVRFDDALGPCMPVGHVVDVLWVFNQYVFAITILQTLAMRHSGDDRHFGSPTLPPKVQTRLQELKRSVCRRWNRILKAMGHG